MGRPRNTDAALAALKRFGKTVQQVREAKGLKQRELSEKASEDGHKIDIRQIQRIERGESISLGVAMRVVAALDSRISIPDCHEVTAKGALLPNYEDGLHKLLQELIDAGGPGTDALAENIRTFHRVHAPKKKRNGQ